jgi:hypothetical protein
MDIREERRVRRNQVLLGFGFFAVVTLGLLFYLGLI